MKLAPPKNKISTGGIIFISCLVALFIVFFLGGYFLITYMPIVKGEDFTGTGTKDVEFHIIEDQTNREIAQNLQTAGIIKDSNYFIEVLNDWDDENSLMVGYWNLKTEMSSSSAIEALLNDENLVTYKFTVPEGKTVAETYEIINEASGISVKDLKATGKELAQELPESANKLLEGWLFPSTYIFPKGTSAYVILNQLIETTKDILARNDVPEEDWEATLIKASIVQLEVGSEYFTQVARVIDNRLEIDMPLGMDTTIAYGAGVNAMDLTYEQLEDPDNPYNTRIIIGLPKGPIDNPGEEAIQAVMNPEKGDWLYFVTTNLETGETKFAETEDEFYEYVEEYENWYAENPLD